MSIAAIRFCAIASAFLALAATPARAEASSPAEAPIPQAAPAGAVFVDPVGFLIFGPTLGAEIGLGQYSVVAYGRWLNAGVLARSLFESSTDKFTFSYGGGLKGRYYLNGGLMGPHVGVAVEALKTRTENHSDKVATNNVIVVPEIEGGYHVAFGRFFAGAALGIGYVLQASKSVVNIDGGTQANNFEAKDYSTIYGSAGVDLGVLF
jgi:hypothetical protein